MIRKATAVVFISIGLIIMLAHSFVPHHHHGANIYFEDFHHENNSHPNDDYSSDNCNAHNHKHDIELCILQQAVILPVNQFNLVPVSVQIDEITQSIDLNTSALAENLFATCISWKYYLSHRDYLSGLFPSFLVSSRILRAPPVA